MPLDAGTSGVGDLVDFDFMAFGEEGVTSSRVVMISRESRSSRWTGFDPLVPELG